MTSPARSISTVSPTRMSLRRISSSLWRLTLRIVTPASSTGSSLATGVSVPVLPTWTSIDCTTGGACPAANLKAMAQRGGCMGEPSRHWGRKRGVEGKRGGLGGRRILKKKKKNSLQNGLPLYARARLTEENLSYDLDALDHDTAAGRRLWRQSSGSTSVDVCGRRCSCERG